MIKVENNIFTVGGVEFIKFPEQDGKVPAVAKDIVKTMDFGKNNNFTDSDVLKYLQNEVLPKIENEIGEANVLEVETDLTSLDGLDTYGKVKSKISLPTFDFYRENVRLFDKHKPDKWWWLATSDSTTEHYEKYRVSCVSPSGSIYYRSFFCNDIGVRPFLFFAASIFDPVNEL